MVTTDSGRAVASAVDGGGNLLGSFGVVLFPMRGEPERLTLCCMMAMGVAVALCALAPGMPATVTAFALAGAALTGQLLFLGPRTVLAAGAALSLLAVTVAVVDRRVRPSPG